MSKELFSISKGRSYHYSSLVKSLSGFLQMLGGCYGVSTQPSLLQVEPQLSQPVFTVKMLQSSYQLCGPPPDLLQQLHVLLMLGTPELDTALQVGSQKSRAEGQNPLLQLADHTALDAAQDTFGCKGKKTPKRLTLKSDEDR
ncbi:hypothetical protein DUI87_08894 [Hirundo rustica rustica]|uniref:Uncharacterized protein n=1 Tax=Hirundo rustica rustica TaxID=333673 RepID=A0A3M0KMF8_HIRRU|nr:hypothetical protein DUI87_08894 [Hirundo rustica rustica]